FQKIIGLKEVPDHSTFSLRAIALEKYVYYGIYAMLIELINPSCAIDGTALRSSLYDSEARYGKGSRLGRYKGYKLHCAACVCNNVLPLSFSITTANVYDNQVQGLLYELKTYNPFIVLADDDQWFKVSKTLEYNLLTDVNMRKAKSIESFKDESRYKNALFMQS
ncbi:transposase, partial [Clostridium botulinum]|nr:transposase [Clostridium botulinum]